MTREEHKAIIEFVEHAATGEQAPMDIEADAIIRALFKRNPDAAYRVTMLAMSLAAPASAESQPGQAASRQKGWLAGRFFRRGHLRREPAIS